MKPLKEPAGRVRYLSDDERARLLGKLGNLNKGMRPVVEAALLIGMRLSEVITLRKTAVDLARRNLTLIKTKNNKVRVLPVNDSLATVLERAMEGQDSQFVFLNTRGNPYSVGGVSRNFAKAVKRAGIENFHFHDLRHDFATQVRRRGTGLDVIADLLGHSSLAMARRYAHIGAAELAAAVAGLDAVQGRSADVIDLKALESGVD